MHGIQVSATDLGSRVMILEMIANKCMSGTRNFNKLTWRAKKTVMCVRQLLYHVPAAEIKSQRKCAGGFYK